MASTLVIGRIESWEAAGLIDPATAARLREAEVAAAPDVGEAGAQPATPLPSPAPPRGAGVTVVELFLYLGAAFVLAAWYALAASAVSGGEDSGPILGGAAVIAAMALGAIGVVLGRGESRFGRPAGVALLAALPNLGFGAFEIAGTLHPEMYPDAPTNALAASLVVLVAAVAARRVVPGLPTQLGLAATAAAAGGFAMSWLDPVLFPRATTDYGTGALDATAALVRVLLSIAWWWLVAAGMAVLLVILDPHPRTEGRTRLGRIAVGATAVLGTFAAAVTRHDWSEGSTLSGEPVLEPWIGVLIVLAVGGVLVGLAVQRSSLGYLWPGALGVFIALTWLNAEYLAVESGLWAALLVEGAVLFGVAFGVHRLRRRLRTGEAGAVSRVAGLA